MQAAGELRRLVFLARVSETGDVTDQSPGPFVALAVLCQRYDRQPDGTVDVTGIVDGIGLQAESADRLQLEPVIVPLTALVALRAGTVRGMRTVEVRGVFPSGAMGPAVKQRVTFSADRPGVTLRVPLELSVQEAGTYWFDVLTEGVLITRISFHAHVEFDGRSTGAQGS